jgi:hypothetical protein
VRRQSVHEVTGELRKSQSVSVVGDSQTGKSSLLWYLAHSGPQLLNRAPRDFVYFNLELVRTEDEFFELLCEELEIVASRGYRLERALQGRRVVLCLDEIEKMTWQGFSLEVRSELRGLADGTHAPFTLVIASRSPLSRVFPDSPGMTSPLAGLCKQVSVPPFTRQEASEFAHWRLNGMGYSITDAAIEQAWQETAGRPAALQLALRDWFEGASV